YCLINVYDECSRHRCAMTVNDPARDLSRCYLREGRNNRQSKHDKKRCENRMPDLVAELHSDSSLMRESSEQTGGECTQSRWVTSLSQFGATTYGSTSRSICSRVEAVKKNVRNSSGVVGGAGVKTP